MIERFMPHGMCFAWRRDVLSLHVVSDALIALAYFSIPVLLVWFVRRRPDLPFRAVFWMFGLFIVACGTTHVLEIVVIWHPVYWTEGAVKAITAAASIGTALMLVPLLPRALALRGPAELERLNAELADTLHELAREHNVASKFQSAALAPMLPDIGGLRFSAVYDPAVRDLEVGGDWYDAFPLQDGRVAVTIGDVSGKGLEAAIIMTKVRQSLRAAAAIQVDPAAILDAADRSLRIEYPERIVSAFVGIVDPIEATFTYANAGHPWPLLRTADGAIRELRSVALPLGLRDRGAPPAQTVPLTVGDVLVLYTDGLVEASRDLAIGEERLLGAVRRLEPETADAARVLRDAVLSGEARDDVAILTMAVRTGEDGTSVERWSFLAEDARAAAATRQAMVAKLRECGATEEDVIAAELVFSELVGNVYRYAPGPVDVVLDLARRLPVLHVLDRGHGFQHVARLPNDLFAERGRGLFLVGAMSEDFHIIRRAGGGSHARVVLAMHVPSINLRRESDKEVLTSALLRDAP